MKRLVKNRANIFDKLAFGISFVPILCMYTLFTYYFNEGLVINGSNISSEGMFTAVRELVGEFLGSISLFQILVIAVLTLYQVWFIVNMFMTKVDKRKKKKTHDFGLFVLSVLIWAFVLLVAGIFIVAIWDFEWLTAWFIGVFIEYQPMATFIAIGLAFALVNIIYNVQQILSKGMKKYLKDCEESDYKFTRGEMLVGFAKLFVVMLFAVIVAYQMMLVLM